MTISENGMTIFKIVNTDSYQLYLFGNDQYQFFILWIDQKILGTESEVEGFEVHCLSLNVDKDSKKH